MRYLCLIKVVQRLPNKPKDAYMVGAKCGYCAGSRSLPFSIFPAYRLSLVQSQQSADFVLINSYSKGFDQDWLNEDLFRLVTWSADHGLVINNA